MKLEPAKERLDAPTFTAVSSELPMAAEVAIAEEWVIDDQFSWLVGLSYSWVVNMERKVKVKMKWWFCETRIAN